MNTNKNKIVWVVIPILFVLIFIVALILIYSKKSVDQNNQAMSEREALIESMTAKGPSVIDPEERKALQVTMSGSNKSTQTPEEQKKVIESMSAN